MTLDMLTDALITAFEIVNQDMTLINFAASVDMLDPEIMRSENPAMLLPVPTKHAFHPHVHAHSR